MDGKLTQDDLGNGNLKIAISNMMDENLSFPEVNGKVKSISIDLGDVSYITSMGILKWIRWLGTFNKPPFPVKLILDRVSLSFIRASETLMDVLPNNAIVNSYYFYFYCPQCNSEQNMMVTNSKDVAEPKPQCQKCGIAMEPELPFSAYELLIKQAP